MIRGACPGALRPMVSGDGLLVRVRPRLGRLDASQAAGLAEAALRHSSGELEITRRANIQIRAVTGHEGLLADLSALGLLDADEAAERRRNIVVEPLHHPASVRIAAEIEDGLHALPELPAKFGFAVDAGPVPMLGDAPADIRVERGRAGLLVRADGAASGRAVTLGTAAEAALTLARRFAARRGTETRARQLVERIGMPVGWEGEVPLPAAGRLAPGPHEFGAVVGAPFGALRAEALIEALARSGARGIRPVPWRLLVLEGGAMPGVAGLVERDDPALSAHACPGAPHCAAATVPTRALAASLAALVPGIHVSGCAKGCALSRPAPVTLAGRAGRYDLIRRGRAGDAPDMAGLSADEARAALEHV